MGFNSGFKGLISELDGVGWSAARKIYPLCPGSEISPMHSIISIYLYNKISSNQFWDGWR